MSRKFDRREQTEKAAFRTRQASPRPQARWLPRFIWRPAQALCILIALAKIQTDKQRKLVQLIAENVGLGGKL